MTHPGRLLIALFLLGADHGHAAAREPLVSRATAWTKLDADATLDLLANMRDEELQEVLRRGPDTVVPLLALRSGGADPASLATPLLASGRPAVRRRVALLAGQIADRELAAALVPLLGDELDGRLERAVIDAVTVARPDGVEAALRGRLAAAATAAKQAVVLSGLAEVATEASEDVLRELLESPSAAVRRLAARGLTHATDAALPDLLERLERDSEQGVKREILRAVGRLGGRGQVAEMRAALGRPLPRVERAMYLEGLAESPDIDAVRAIVGILETPTSDLRREAAMLLGTRTEELARTALLSAIAKEKDPNVFRFEAVSLGRLGETRAAPKLTEALADPNLALFAALALADMGDDSGAGLLVQGLEDVDYGSLCSAALVELHDASALGPMAELFERARSAAEKGRVLGAMLAIMANQRGQ